MIGLISLLAINLTVVLCQA